MLLILLPGTGPDSRTHLCLVQLQEQRLRQASLCLEQRRRWMFCRLGSRSTDNDRYDCLSGHRSLLQLTGFLQDTSLDDPTRSGL